MKFINKLFSKKEKKTGASIYNANNTLIDLLFNTNVNINNISDNDLKTITNDLSFTQADISRKAATEKKDIVVICEDETIKDNLKKCFYSDVISQILETYLYGLNVFEVNYKEIDGLYYPFLEQRDFRNFGFKEEELKYKSHGVFKDIPDYKIIYGLNRSNFYRQYGDSILSKLYFPVKLKNASLKFWIKFIEKFGSPWAIAKTGIDPEGLAKEVFAMLSGDVAVIDEDESITLTQPTNDGGFEKLITYCDNQINKVILGANLTANITGGSYAAAQVHNEIREDIAANDAKILMFVLNRAVKFFKEVNALDIDIEVKLFDNTSPNLELAGRDFKLCAMGFIPTNDYIRETYNYDIDEEKSKEIKERLIPNKLAFKDSLNAPKFIDKFDKAIFELDTQKADKELENALERILSECDTYEDAFDKFAELYDAPLDKLEALMFKAIANSELTGTFDE